MAYGSILYENEDYRFQETQPDFFSDLNLDQIVEAMTESRQEYDLKPFFWTSVRDVETVHYWQEVMRDLKKEKARHGVEGFSEKMGLVHRYLEMADRLDNGLFRKGWVPEAALVY